MPWAALMDDWETVVLDVQAVFGEVWHRCLGEPWPWWRSMVLNLFQRPDTVVHQKHILPRLDSR